MSNPTVCINAENVLTMGVLNKIIEKSFHFDAGLDIEKKKPTHLVAFTVLGYPGYQRFPASAQSSPQPLLATARVVGCREWGTSGTQGSVGAILRQCLCKVLVPRAAVVGHICGHLGHSVGPCTDEHLRNVISRCDNGSFVGLYSVTPLYKDTKNNLCNNLDLKYFQILVQYKQTIVILNNQGIFLLRFVTTT